MRNSTAYPKYKNLQATKTMEIFLSFKLSKNY